MSTIVTRAGKGAPLTHNEVDANFTNLNADKYQAGDSPSFGNITVTGTVDGRDVSADGAKLDGIEAGATADQTAAEILTAIKTVDGALSGLDADLLDGNHASAFSLTSHNHTLDGLSNTTITSNTSGEILKWNGTAWINNTLAEAGIQPAGSYLTGNQTITLSGDLSGSGTTSINAQLAANVVGANELNVVGNGTTAQYLRSDGDGTFTWATPPDTNTTYTAGGGLTLAGTVFSHTDTSAQASVNNSNNVVIQDVTLDTYGHVTGLASRTIIAPTVNGTSGQTLISNGTATPTWATVSSGSKVLTSFSVSGSPMSLVVTNMTGYHSYRLILRGLRPTSTALLLMRSSANNGSSWITSSDYYQTQNYQAPDGANGFTYYTQTYWQVSTNQGIGSAYPEGLNVAWDFHGCDGSQYTMGAEIGGAQRDYYAGGRIHNLGFSGGFARRAVDTTNALQMYWSDGTTFQNQGTVTLIGIGAV